MSTLKLGIFLTLFLCTLPFAQSKPNIVFIFADDMGYGDLKSLNPDSKIPTPALDQLVQEGRIFTQAHSPASFCVPARYGLLTGQYPHRTAPWEWEKGSIIPSTRLTLGKMLQQAGYHTGMVGKWHLGFDSGLDFDCDAPLQGGPRDRGFDSYYGIHASLDIPPYFYIENKNCVEAPTGDIARGSTPGWTDTQGAFWREGKIAPGFVHEEVQGVFIQKSVEFMSLHKQTRPNDPFFLYLALAGPHTPWLPLAPAAGNGAGLYGDFMAYMDEGVGKVMAALDSLGYAENTLVFFASDNGPKWYPEDVTKFGHASAGHLRGMKMDNWEGGHRIPLVAKWPGKIPAGTVSGELVSLVDIFTTCAAIIQAEVPDNAGEDSYNLLPILMNGDSEPPLREALVTSGGLYFTVQKGDWKLITGLGSGGFSSPKKINPVEGGPKGQLYNLAADPGEQNNLWLQRQDIVASLTALLDKYDADGRSAPSQVAGLLPASESALQGNRAVRAFFVPFAASPVHFEVPEGATGFSIHAPDGRRLGEWKVSPDSRRFSFNGGELPPGLHFRKFTF